MAAYGLQFRTAKQSDRKPEEVKQDDEAHGLMTRFLEAHRGNVPRRMHKHLNTGIMEVEVSECPTYTFADEVDESFRDEHAKAGGVMPGIAIVTVGVDHRYQKRGVLKAWLKHTLAEMARLGHWPVLTIQAVMDADFRKALAKMPGAFQRPESHDVNFRIQRAAVAKG